MSPVPCSASASSPPGATASSWVAARPGLCVLQAGLSAWGCSTSQRARHPCHSTAEDLGAPDTAKESGGTSGGGGRRSVHPAEGGPNLGPEPAWLCAPAAARPGESARPSCRRPPPRNWTRRRRPPGRRIPRSRTALAPAAAAAAKVPSKFKVPRWPGGGTEGEASGNQAPAGALRARAAAQLLPGGPGGRRWASVWGRLNLGAPAQLAPLGTRDEGRRKGLQWAWFRGRPELTTRIRPGRGGARRFSVWVPRSAGCHPHGADRLRSPGLCPGPGFLVSLFPTFH